MNLIEPTPQNVRDEIEAVPEEETQMFLKCLLTFGGRSAEFAGVNCTNEKAYGTTGKDYCWIDEYHPKAVSTDEQTERLNKIIANPNMSTGQAMAIMIMPPSPVKVAVFKIPIAKKHLLQGESIFYRHDAIPLDKKYEPWTEQILNYYRQRGKEVLFPENRKHYLDYLRMHKVFKGFAYPVERYTVRTVLGKLETVPEVDPELPMRTFKRIEKTGMVNQYDAKPQHNHKFKLHGLRHVRTKELNDFYEIKDALALSSFIGWAPARGATSMIARYGNIYQNWGSYIQNLLKVRPRT
jgi:hypothetical protein